MSEMEREVDKRLAALTETRNTQLASSEQERLTRRADGKGGDSGDSVEKNKLVQRKNKKKPIGSDRPSHRRRLPYSGLADPGH
jgi:hypothetical protein